MNLRAVAGPASLAALVAFMLVCPASTQGGERTDSTDIGQLLDQGSDALASGNLKKALELFEKADSLADGRSASALIGAASASNALGNFDQQEEFARRLIDISHVPMEKATGYYLLGISLSNRKRPSLDEAAAAFESALSFGRRPSQ